MGTVVKEKTNTWNKSCRESAQRESELYIMVEQAAIDERQEHKERIIETSKRKRGEEEARGLIEEKQRNLDEAQARASENGTETGPRARRIHFSLPKKKRCARTTSWTRCGRRRKAERDTERLILDKDFKEIMNKVSQAGWNESGRKDSGHKMQMKFSNRHSFVLKIADGRHNELCGRMVLS